MKITLFRKFLSALLMVAIVPLLLSSAILFINLKESSSRLARNISDTTDRQASEALQSRARQVAEDVARFLKQCENDLLLVAAISRDSSTLDSFYQSRNLGIWRRIADNGRFREEQVAIPVYSSLELIDSKGMQRFVIENGAILPVEALRNVSIPSNTRFRNEHYFTETARLKKGEIYVSHLTGFHLGKKEQLGTASDSEEANGNREYEGVIRFATPLYNSDRQFEGIIVLSLDHRHLMEFSQHILPGSVEKTVFPSYRSGNYAFIFDDEGWIITHPNYWDIRGVDRKGREIPPYSKNSSKIDIDAGRIPFNLDHAGFIHPNYPVVSAAIRKGESGYLDTTNVGGAKKVMAYAPIPYSTGVYKRHGVFGGVTIGFQTDLFHEPSRAAAGIIHEQMRFHLVKSALILSLTMVMAILAAWWISRSITRPLAILTRQTRAIAEGESSSRVEIRSADEVGELANDFNRMASELENRNSSLLETLSELDRSRKNVTDERNFMEGVVNSISSAILPFSPEGRLISSNSTGRRILGEVPEAGSHYRTVFRSWPEVIDRIEATVSGQQEFGRKPYISGSRHYDIGVFPIGSNMEQGITVTIRDETEKEQMRQEMTRMDRLASLGRLSAGVAHEVRNPLTGITLLLDDLHDRPAFDQETRELIHRALMEIERVEKLINSLLNYAAPQGSDMRLASLNELVEETLLFFRKVCEKSGVKLESRVGKLPEFRFDPEKIRQVLLNLLRNSLSAISQEGVISVTTESTQEMAVLTVSDNGQGISADDLPLVFEPFFTASSGGTGLGLSICHRIIEEHGGRIEVNSNRGCGTTITVRLPLKGRSDQ